MRILRTFLQKGAHMLQCFCGQRSKSTTIPDGESGAASRLYLLFHYRKKMYKESRVSYFTEYLLSLLQREHTHVFFISFSEFCVQSHLAADDCCQSAETRTTPERRLFQILYWIVLYLHESVWPLKRAKTGTIKRLSP